MVLPTDEKIFGQTLEDRLAHKFNELQEARENRQSELFDEIAKSIEVLLKGVPDAYSDLMKEKTELNRDLEVETRDIQSEVSFARDDIHKQAIWEKRGYKAMWDYREVYEEVIMDTFQKYQLVTIRRPQKSFLLRPDDVPPNVLQQMNLTPEQMRVPIPPPPPQPPQQQQKEKPSGRVPRLSFKRKKASEHPTDFNL
jgi:hypothetical protein